MVGTLSNAQPVRHMDIFDTAEPSLVKLEIVDH